MMASGFRVRVTGLVFVLQSASLILKQVPTCIRKPKTNTFDKSIMFLYWLFLVVLDGFRSLQMVLGRFQIVLGRFRSFQVVLARSSLSKYLWNTHITQYLKKERRQTIKFGQLIEYNMKNIFVKKSYTRYGGETILRPFSKKSRLSISLNSLKV